MSDGLIWVCPVCQKLFSFLHDIDSKEALTKHLFKEHKDSMTIRRKTDAS